MTYPTSSTSSSFSDVDNITDIANKIEQVLKAIESSSSSPPAGGLSSTKERWEEIVADPLSVVYNASINEINSIVKSLDSPIQAWTQSSNFSNDWFSLSHYQQELFWMFSPSAYLNIRRQLPLDSITLFMADVLVPHSFYEVGSVVKEVFNLPINVTLHLDNSHPTLLHKILNKAVSQDFPSYTPISSSDYELCKEALTLALLKLFPLNIEPPSSNNISALNANKHLLSLVGLTVPFSWIEKVIDYSNKNNLHFLRHQIPLYLSFIQQSEEDIKPMLDIEKEKSFLASRLPLVPSSNNSNLPHSTPSIIKI